MRLKPPVSFEEALAWLIDQACSTWGVKASQDLTEALAPMARNMVAISAAEVPTDTEPLLI